MSVRPTFCDAILNGAKSVEYRRSAPGSFPPLTAFLYATRPVGAIAGTVVVTEVRRGPVDVLLDLTRDDPLYAHYRSYLGSLDRAAALMLDLPRRFPSPVALTTVLPARRPPQSWQYISDGLAARIWDLAK